MGATFVPLITRQEIKMCSMVLPHTFLQSIYLVPVISLLSNGHQDFDATQHNSGKEIRQDLMMPILV